MTHPDVYLISEEDGTWTAFVRGIGFRANSPLSAAITFIREETGRTRGHVPCWDAEDRCWTSQIDISFT